MTAPKTIHDYALDYETAQPDRVYLTQPTGGASVHWA